MKNSMFFDWAYWRPIFLTIWSLTGLVTFFAVASPILIEIAVGLFVLAIVLGFLHMIGAACHESYMANIKNNYERITDRKWDDK